MKFLTIAKLLAVLPLAMTLTNCDKPKPKTAPAGTYAFDVMVRLSPKAEAAIPSVRSYLETSGVTVGKIEKIRPTLEDVFVSPSRRSSWRTAPWCRP